MEQQNRRSSPVHGVVNNPVSRAAVHRQESFRRIQPSVLVLTGSSIRIIVTQLRIADEPPMDARSAALAPNVVPSHLRVADLAARVRKDKGAPFEPTVLNGDTIDVDKDPRGPESRFQIPIAGGVIVPVLVEI